MFLAQALNNIKLIEPRIDRQQVLVETLKNPEKLAKTLLRIEFLTACRKFKVVPRFIEDALKPVNKLFKNNNCIRGRADSFATTLLNEAIAESFRQKAFLERRRACLKKDVSYFLTEEKLTQIALTCNQVFDITIREKRPHLIRKFNRRRQCKADENKADRTEMEEIYDTANQADGSDILSNSKRVNNLSSLALNDHQLDILSKGPNFAVTQSISKNVLLEVENSVERLAYGKRWKDDISRRLRAIKQYKEIRGTEPENEERQNGETEQQDMSRATEIDSVQQTEDCRTGNVVNRPMHHGPEGDEDGDARRDNITAGQLDDDGSVEGSERRAARGSVPDLNFRFPDLAKRFPPPSDVDVERNLRKLKLDVLRTYKNHKITNCNMTAKEKDFIRELGNNGHVVVKQSDKCKGLVLLDKETYKDKVDLILDDPEKYENLSKNPVARVEAKTKQVFKSVAKGKLPDKIISDLTPNHSRTPVFYGLPKDHKPDVPLRPVVSGSGGPTEKTACLLEQILKQLLVFIPTHLRDTKDFLSRANDHCKSQPLAEDAIFFSIDVVNLYGSIPVEEAIEAAKNKLETHGKDIDTFGLSYEDICALLDQCLHNNVFSFGDNYYRQKQGIAMGNPCAPPLAIIFLDRFEQQALSGTVRKPVFLVRYIDDYAGFWTYGEQALTEFLHYLNSLHPNLSFTLDYSKPNKAVPFLDTSVTLTSVGGICMLETELYIKPMNSGIVLHATSAHPTSTKHNMIRNMFHRAFNNSSSKEREENSVEKIRSLLLGNGYSSRLLKRLLREVRLARPRGAKGRRKLEAKEDGYLTLPYIDENLLCKVKRIVNRSGLNVKLAWRNENKLKNKLVHSAFKPPCCPGGKRCNLCQSGFKGQCTQKNVVYLLKCSLCNREYIGESKRPLRLRYNEHVRDMVSRKVDTPMGEHFRTAHPEAGHTPIPFEVKVLYKARDHPDRKIAESVLIKKQRPELNANVSSWPIM